MSFSNAFINFETAPVHPIDLSPDGRRLAVCNLPDGRLEIFDVTSGRAISQGSIPVGLDPVSVRFRNDDEAWVVNHISDSISVVNLATMRVVATLDTLDTPSDVIFAGAPEQAFVSCALPNTVQAFDPLTRTLRTNIAVAAERPRALATSPDRTKVYAAIFESGNATTIVGPKFRNLLFFSNAVSRTDGPYGGLNPPPNRGDAFVPPLNSTLPTTTTPPATGIIVRRNEAGRWRDDNGRDWTEFVSGTNAAWNQRVTGWDLPDRDLAIIDTANHVVTYATGLMNLCMAVGVNPASGRVAVVGTDAINEVRFEPNLNGVFVRVSLALVDPGGEGRALEDLNPHLDYQAPTAPAAARERSIGDPRGIVWTADGSRGYVAGMGSRNVVLVDAEGRRTGAAPIELGEGPCGLALDEPRGRLYVYHRFSSSLSVVETSSHAVLQVVTLFDPTPVRVAAGRRHLYDTRRTSGLGQASCASCHPDARMDRLAWDLGNPAGNLDASRVNHQGTMVTNEFHPMKGVMLTQTLQDIIGHEPFHWRGDRPDIESFNGTFTNLQGAATGLAGDELRELRDFLASVRFPPNPHRLLDNSLSTNVPLPGHRALGDDLLAAGAPLPPGNAEAGLRAFNAPGNFCITCHTLPTGLGADPFTPGENAARHFPLAFRLEGPLRSKISQFRNLAERIGMDGLGMDSRAGFGFGHDGSVDSLTRFLNGLRVVQDQSVADLIAFLLSVRGSDALNAGSGAPPDSTPPAAVGRQLTLRSADIPGLLSSLVALAHSPTSRVELIVKGAVEGLPRGWVYDRTFAGFQSDRKAQQLTLQQLATLAPQAELTFTVVPAGMGRRMGIDRDLDGQFDRDEMDVGANPADVQLLPEVLVAGSEVPVGLSLDIQSVLPAWPAPGAISWLKDNEPIAGLDRGSFTLSNVTDAVAGVYQVVTRTAFQSLTSAPVRLTVVPLKAAIAPSLQTVRRSSNAVFTAVTEGHAPFQYQWQFAGQDLPGATFSSLTVTNAQVVQEGSYRVRIANAFGAVTSAPVELRVLVDPAVVTPPVNLSVVEGDDATFSVAISGHPPPFGYQLRRSTLTLTSYVSAERLGFLTLYNVQGSNAGTYRILVTNAANPSPGLTLPPVTLTVLADADHDGLPDVWEMANGLATNNASDAAFDSDLDGPNNREEYLAGTDPRDAGSVLKVERINSLGTGSTVVQFLARSNRTYTVEWASRVGEAGPWQRLADVAASSTDRWVFVTNGLGGAGERYYRLVTPRE